MNLLYNAGSIPSALMYAALNEQDLLCRAFGACRQYIGELQQVGKAVAAQVDRKHFDGFLNKPAGAS